ncbi:MAG: hypothetical protein EBR82_52015 [Caulobacteraceae bacterium]|nr:hypothetical protein [Caulobacteraceae bacterium]
MEAGNKAVRQYLASIGSKGGKATGPSKARTSEQARKAVMKRWENYRKKQKEDPGKADTG